MDAEAIKHIESLAVAGSYIDDARNVDYPLSIIPQGAEIVSLERFNDNPNRMRSKFRTERVADFAAYAKENADEEKTAVFVSPDGDGATAIFDYGTPDVPLWGDHRGELTLQQTPAYKALVKACQNPLSKRDMVDFLEDWGHIVTVYSGEENIPLTKALSMVRRSEITATRTAEHEEGDWNHKRSAMEELDVKTGKSQPPSKIVLYAGVYTETKVRDISARIVLRTGDDEPRFGLRITGHDDLLDQTAKEVEERLIGELAGNVERVFVGEVART